MIKTNMHIHSKYSWDSKMEIPEIARILAENNVRYATLTDHVELDREELNFILKKLLARHLEVKQINEQYEGKLKLLEGIEISEPHWYPDKVEYLLEHTDLDFVMGSIHQIDKSGKNDLDKKRITYLYYKEMLKMIKSGNFDVLGHLDYINRYYKEDYSDDNQVKEVLDEIKEYNKIIEINTSAKRRTDLNLFPSIDKICHYSLVSNYVTIGTDAHRYHELVDNLEQAEFACQEIGIKPVIYQKRKKTII